ncbi:MAG: sugar phosphate nucleotidyltransferase [Polyangiaceae bacterium]
MSGSSSDVFALVLAGGAGTRFWPASRALRPKQLLPLAGEGALLRQTVERVLPVCAEGGSDAWERVLIATGAHLATATQAILPELHAHRFMLEPAARNTAPCIAWGAAKVAGIDPEAVVMVLPSDHHIGDVERFRATLRAAIASARTGVITTIGIRPTRAETGFGYIEIEGAAEEGKAQRGLKFVEKPDAERAAAYVAGGRHLWNAGMFFFRACDMLAAIEEHQPQIAEGLRVLSQAAGRGEEEQALATVFPAMPSISIDHGVMDHLSELAVVPGDFGWSDVGSFQAAWELAAKDGDGNAAPAESVLLETTGSYVLDLRSKAEGAGKRVIALAGVADLVVVETDDALLVTTRDRAQDVKRIVDELKKRGDAGLT